MFHVHPGLLLLKEGHIMMLKCSSFPLVSDPFLTVHAHLCHGFAQGMEPAYVCCSSHATEELCMTQCTMYTIQC